MNPHPTEVELPNIYLHEEVYRRVEELERQNASLLRLLAERHELDMANHKAACDHAARVGLDPIEFQPVFVALQMCQISTGRARELFREWLLGVKPVLPEIDDTVRFTVWDQENGLLRGLSPSHRVALGCIDSYRSAGHDVTKWKVAAVVEIEEMW